MDTENLSTNQEQDREAFRASLKHTKHLRKAEHQVEDAKGLAETLRHAMLSGSGYDPVFAPEVLERIITRLEKAQSLMGRHSIVDGKLFVDRVKPADDVATAADVALDRYQVECNKLSPEEVGLRLRAHCWDVGEMLSAFPEEDGFSVHKTFTRKGLKDFLAEREYLQSLLPDEGGAA